MKRYIKSSIKPIDAIPENPNIKSRDLTPKNYSQKIYDDLKEAYDKHIAVFEFEGDYNYNNFTTYAHEPIKRLTQELIVPGVEKAIKEKFMKDMHKDISYLPNDLIKLNLVDGYGSFITIVTIRGEDRKHVYGKINFNYAEELKTRCIRRIKLHLQERQFERNAERRRRSKLGGI